MKKMLALLLAALLTVAVLSGCCSTAVVAVPDPNSGSGAQTNPDTEKPQTGNGEAVKTGLYLSASVSGSKSAQETEAGKAQADIQLIAVTITDDGVIDSCVIDAIQSKADFDSNGTLTSDLSAPVLSKNELGDNYGMKKASSIGKEWYEQVQALADYVEGKTLEEIRGIAITEDGKAADADLASSVTVSIAGYLDGIEQAAANAVHLGASQGDRLVLVSSTSLANSKNASAQEQGVAETYSTVAAVTFNGDVISSSVIDGIQAKVQFGADGQITTDLAAAQPSKNTLKENYGMKQYSGIGKEWYEQAAAFCDYIQGKTPAEVAGIALNDKGGAADADLAASVTISIGEFQSLIAKAAG